MSKTRIHLSLLAVAAFAAIALLPARALSADTIAYWPFGTNGFHDVSGNGHDLTSTTVTESDAGYVTLNGTSQFLTTASALDLSGETAVTFECWTRMTAENKDFPLLMCSANPQSGTGGFVLYYGKSLHIFQAQYRMAASGDQVWQMEKSTSASQLQDNAWHHVAYVVDRSKTGWDSAKLYVDGVEQDNNWGVSGAVPAFFNDTFMIGGGANYASGNNFYTGYVDDVRISRGALTPDQFLKYPSVGKTMNAESPALPVVAYWPFGGKGGRDATGNGFDLTMSGTAIPLKSGTPSPSWSTRLGDYAFSSQAPLPFSAFSKTGFTVELFAMAQSSSTNMGMVVESSTSYWNNNGAFRLSYDANPDGYKTISTAFRVSGGTAESSTTEEAFGSLGDNRWRHIAVVYDPAKTGAGIVTLYIDGVAAGCTAANASQGAFPLSDQKLYLGRRSNIQIGNENQALPFYGSLDDVRITAGVLTPDQFLPARSAGSTVALYRFDRETLEDQSGNGNALVNEGNATFGVGADAASGTGIVLNGSSQWLHTLNALNLTHTKAATIEFDYYSDWPGNWGTGTKIGPFVISEDPDAVDGISIYNPSSSIQAQWRVASGTWRIDTGSFDGNGYHEGRYSIDISASPQTALYVDGVKGSVSANNSGTMDNLGSQVLHFGHGPNYVAERYLKGKFCRIAISDVALAQGDFVLDNLIDPETKRTLAYWNFADSTDKSGNGHGLTESGTSRRNGALDLNGSASAETGDTLDLSGLTQATIECFVLFGETPSSGTLFSMGTGAGSFAVAADAAAGTLSGSFIPYDHLAASNGGSTALAPLAGKTAWHHVALVIDRTSPGADAVRFYVDYERATPAGRAWDAAARMLDGTLSVGSGFTGRIDDLRVSAGALAPEEFIQPAARTETADAFTLIIN